MSIKKKSLFHFIGLNVLLIWMRISAAEFNEERPLTLGARATSIMLSKLLCVEMPHVYGPHAINYLSIHIFTCVIIASVCLLNCWANENQCVRRRRKHRKLIKFTQTLKAFPYWQFIDVMFGFVFEYYDATEMWNPLRCVFFPLLILACFSWFLNMHTVDM